MTFDVQTTVFVLVCSSSLFVRDAYIFIGGDGVRFTSRHLSQFTHGFEWLKTAKQHQKYCSMAMQRYQSMYIQSTHLQLRQIVYAKAFTLTLSVPEYLYLVGPCQYELKLKVRVFHFVFVGVPP